MLPILCWIVNFWDCNKRSWITVLSISLACGPSLHAQDAFAENVQVKPIDRVWYGPANPSTPDVWEPLPSTVYVGQIQELDSEKFIITSEDGAMRTLASDRVIAVQPAWQSDAAKQGDQLFLAGKFREAVPILQPALASGLPRWQQRLILARIIESAWAIGSISTAGKLSLTMIGESPPAMLLGSLPLAWTEGKVDRTTVESAASWVDDSRPAIQLMGASWLVNSDARDKAIAILQKLQNGTDRSLAQLAAAQLWRLESTSAAQFDSIIQWQLRRDRMALPLQAGPTLLIADRLARAQQTDLAIAEYQRIVTLHADRYDRVLTAQDEIKRLLAAAGRTTDLEKYLAATSRTSEP